MRFRSGGARPPDRNEAQPCHDAAFARRYPRGIRRPITNVIGFDDGPFPQGHRGDVNLVGVVCSRTRVDGILTGRIRRDGSNATRRMIDLVQRSQFVGHVRAVLLHGIAVGGFNVVDVFALSKALAVPVLVVTRKQPDLASMKRAIARVPSAERKWQLIERAGPMEPLRGIFVQRIHLDREEAEDLLVATTLHGLIPEPLRVAHLIAGGITTGRSRGRA